MKKIKLSRMITTLMAIATLVCSFGTTNVFAAELDSENTIVETCDSIETSDIIEPRAGIETLPLGWHTISSNFTITGHNYTPVKTVEGRYLRIYYNSSSSTTDITLWGYIRILDYNTKEVLNESPLLVGDGDYRTAEVDLGTTGRKIQIYTVIINALTGEEVQRSVTFTNYQSYVHN